MADNMTVAQRSSTMSRIRSCDTRPELAVRRLVHARGLRYRKHVAALPGRPDLVFSGAKVAVFVDGDFWHGWRFSQWKDKLAPYWKEKIERNRRRDARNVRRLRHQGSDLRQWGEKPL
jgi:DNA mismatch endonuclease (patch repair protein)